MLLLRLFKHEFVITDVTKTTFNTAAIFKYLKYQENWNRLTHDPVDADIENDVGYLERNTILWTIFKIKLCY